MPRLEDYLDPVDPMGTQGAPQSPGGFQPQPPKDEAEMQQRVGGWQKFLQTLGTDSALREGLLSFGATALQPRVGGQTSAGQIGQALQSGLNTFQGRRQELVQNDQTERRTAASETQAAAIANQANATAEATRGNQRRLDAREPITLDVAREELNALRFENSPEMREEKLKALRARIDASKAQAGAARGESGTQGDRERELFIQNQVAQGTSKEEAINRWFQFQATGRAGQFDALEAEIDAMESFNVQRKAILQDILMDETEKTTRLSRLDVLEADLIQRIQSRGAEDPFKPAGNAEGLTSGQQAALNRYVETFKQQQGRDPNEGERARIVARVKSEVM